MDWKNPTHPAQSANRRNGEEAAAEVIVRRVKRDEEVVCYGDVGCFRDEGPFDYLDMGRMSWCSGHNLC